MNFPDGGKPDNVTTQTPLAISPGPGWWSGLAVRGSRGLLVAGVALTALLVAVAVLAPFIAPYSPTQAWLGQVTPDYIPGPSSEHLLGLDANGRDVFSRLLYGARTSLITGIAATLIGAAIGSLLGLVAATAGGVIDLVVMRLIDSLMIVPGLVLAIGIAAMLGQSTTAIVIAIAVTSIPTFARLLRGSVLGEQSMAYVGVLGALGFSRTRIASRHVLPNAVSPLITQGTMTVATAILESAALAFLGLGSKDPSLAEWGRMLADAQGFLSTAPRLAFIPCVAIMAAATGFTLLGEALHRRLQSQ